MDAADFDLEVENVRREAETLPFRLDFQPIRPTSPAKRPLPSQLSPKSSIITDFVIGTPDLSPRTKSPKPSSFLIFVGSTDHAYCKSTLDENGITHLLNATYEDWAPPADTTREIFYAFPRRTKTAQIDFRTLCHWMHGAIEGGGRVLIYSEDGMGLAPALAVAYNLIHDQVPLQKAVHNVGREISDDWMEKLQELSESLEIDAAVVEEDSQENAADDDGGGGGDAEPNDSDVSAGSSEEEQSYHESPARELPASRAHRTLIQRQVTLFDLIERGYLKAGARLTYKRSGNRGSYHATVCSDGTLCYQTRSFETPSEWCTAVLRETGGSKSTKVNGWDYARTKSGFSLNEFRKKLLAGQTEEEEEESSLVEPNEEIDDDAQGRFELPALEQADQLDVPAVVQLLAEEGDTDRDRGDAAPLRPTSTVAKKEKTASASIPRTNVPNLRKSSLREPRRLILGEDGDQEDVEDRANGSMEISVELDSTDSSERSSEEN